jgi:tetratricopeptide (TPR) repeat protein
MTANHALGTVYQRMGEWDMAKKFHERHEEIAYSVDILEEVAKSNIELHNVYLVLAQKMDTSDTDKSHIALEFYHKCLESAKKCWDKGAEGEANGKIGNLYLRCDDAASALPYLRNFSQIAADLGDAEGRCRASSALAWALDSLGDDNSALKELTLVHSISEQAGDAYLQAQACRSLGTLYSKVGKLELAVETLQKHFDLYKMLAHRAETALSVGGKFKATTKKAGDKTDTKLVQAKDLDLARLYVGISKGNLLMGKYVTALEHDMSSLLDWKLSRTDL